MRSSRPLAIARVVSLCASGLGAAHAQVVSTTAATAATASVQPAPASPLLGLMQGLVGLVVVIGVIYIAAWAMKKIGPKTRSSGVVQVVGGASVGPREKVVVVRFGGQTLLLGVAPGQVSLLHTAGSDAPVDDGTLASPAGPRFVDRLRAARSGA